MRKLVCHTMIFTAMWLFCTCQTQDKTQNTEKEQKQVTPKPTFEKAIKTDKKVILFFGNSLTAGFGLEPEKAFPALIQGKIDEMKQNYLVINAGVSGETTASGNTRLDWVIKNQQIAIFVLELGGNDGLRGIQLSETRKNLEKIIQKIKQKDASTQIILAGMQIPPNMSQNYTDEFKKIYPELAKKHKLLLIPFLLEKVGGEPNLNLPDGIHPNAEGHKIVAQNVWQVLKDAL